MEIDVTWYHHEADPESLDFRQALYAYAHPNTREFLYIGKAGAQSIRERIYGEHKLDVYDRIYTQHGIRKLDLLVGDIEIPRRSEYTDELLSNIETLLIYSIQPTANIQATKSRTSRPGMVVRCLGDWPYQQRIFRDF